MSTPGTTLPGIPSRSVAVTVSVAALVLPFALLLIPHVGAGFALAGSTRPLPAAAAAAAGWGFLLVAVYGLSLWLGTTAARWAARTPRTLWVTSFARTATILAVTAGLAACLILLVAPTGSTSWVLDVASAASVIEVSAGLPAALVAVGGALVLLYRAARNSRKELTRRAAFGVRTVPAGALDSSDPLGPRDEPGDANRWADAYRVPGVDPAVINERWRRGEATTGFCLSGGGIRSACFSLGALESLRAELVTSDYLVSVSGGGYAASGLQHVLTGVVPSTGIGVPGTVLRDEKTAYTQGTPEYDHLRRHASYLASTPLQTLGALGHVARGLVLSLTILFGPALVLGVLTGWLYERIPLTSLAPLAPLSSLTQPLGYPLPRLGALIALGVLVLAAFLIALYARGEEAERESWARLVPRLVAVALIVAVLTLVLPLLVWLAAWLFASAGWRVEIGGPVGTVLLTYGATIAGMVWRHRDMLGKQVTGLLRRKGSGGVPAVVPSSILQRLLVLFAMGVLALVWLSLFAGSATTLGAPAALWTAAGSTAVLLVLGGLFDITSLSLHPFYRRRLSGAIGVRRVRRDSDEQIVAVPYDEAERTTLSDYGKVARRVRFPEVVFAATANLTGEGRTPSGLDAVSYTMSAQWTGGPDVGWVRTGDLERAVTRRFRRDLTVQGAMALSGAAFASAMGKHSRWTGLLFAVTGARLGAWLPNPRFVHEAQQAAQRGDWTYPWLPRARRFSYLLREVAGVHPHRDRLLHISDGAHYDNLGLVELFRRRCTRIFCIDASNDPPPTAGTLAQALQLAAQELGVRVDLHEPWRAAPGTGEPPEAGEKLASRLAQTPIITGTITYPPESGLDEEVTGTLIVARGLLSPDLPYPLLSYAAGDPVFPYDNTADQWFDDAKFGAYTDLGREVGAAAREACVSAAQKS